MGGQKAFQIQAYPFRMTAANFARHRTNPNIPFWKMLKQGSDQFEVSRLEPRVDVCERHYVFNAQQPANATKPIAFNPIGHCPVFEVPEEIATAALEKQRNDEYQIAQLTTRNVPVAPIKTGLDGGMNPVFAAKNTKPSATFDADGRLRAAPAAPANGKPSDPDTTATVVAAADAPTPRPAPQPKQPSEPSWTSKLFGGMFAGQPKPESTRVASADPARSGFGSLFTSNGEGPLDRMQRALGLRGPEPTAPPAAKPAAAPKPKHHSPTAVAAAKPKPKTETADAGKPAASPAAPAAPQQQANAEPPKPATAIVINGAQPVVPAGSFASRWSGLR
jgi:hypothetical protein